MCCFYHINIVASIAYCEPAPALDGNQARVLARMEEERAKRKAEIEARDAAKEEMRAQRKEQRKAEARVRDARRRKSQAEEDPQGGECPSCCHQGRSYDRFARITPGDFYLQ